MDRTLVIIKPDAVGRSLVGAIIERLERKGLKLVGMKMTILDGAVLRAHYAHLAEEPFFPELAKFMGSCPVVVTCWEGVDCVATVRSLCGTTKAREADPGTIRGDWAMSVQKNLVHASDSGESAERECALFFAPGELYDYDLVGDSLMYTSQERD